MFQNYLITAWRNIIKNGVFSFINIFGLALGLMSCILIMLFVNEESGFDSWLKDSDRLVRIHSEYNMPNQAPFLTVRSAGKMMEAIRDYAKNEIETGVRLIQWGMTVRQNDEAYPEQITMVDGTFFDVFDLPFAHGTKESSFNKPMDTVITEEVAMKYFGRTDVIGESLVLCCVSDQTATLSITGVVKNLPEATHLDLNMIIYLQPNLFVGNDSILNTWTSVNLYTYFKLNANTAISQIQERINYWLNNESPLKSMWKGILGDKGNDILVTDVFALKAMLVPDIHLHAKRDAGNMGDFKALGDINMINTFVVVAAMVLLIACINFMNLSTAKASKRAKEVAMRKVLGASRSQVAIQFLSEAVAIVLIALFLGLVGVELILPFYNDILGRELELHLFDNMMLLGYLILLAIFVGLLAGLYPALYLSRFLPGHILKSSKSSESGHSAKLRTFLVVFQFSTSIILVISTLVVYGQTIYSNSMDVGYKSDNKLVLNIRPAGDRLPRLKQELLNLPEVTSVVYSSESPTQDNENNNLYKLLESHSDETGNEPLLLNYHSMGYGFFEAYKVQPLAGRLFDEAYGTDAYVHNESSDKISQSSTIINQTALKKLGFSNPEQAVGKTLETSGGKRHLTIIGVIPDIYFRSIKFGVRPSVYSFNQNRFRVANISFKTDDMSGLVSKIERLWKTNVPMQPIDIQFLSEMMSAQYEDERITAQLFLVFSILAFVVGCLGLYGLTAFTIERKTKEIGIRKVMGARIIDIVSLLIWQFSKPVIIANLIAWPVATFMMLKWLESFPYRIDTLWLIPICLSVSLLSLLLAWVTVGGNTLIVARRSPIHSLRYE